MFKVLILAAQNTVSDARMEFLIRDRLSWLRFLGFNLGAVTPDENTIRLFREKLTHAGALDALFAAFDRQLRERGYLPMGGQIVDATLVAATKAPSRPRRRRLKQAGVRGRSGPISRRMRRRRTPMRAGRSSSSRRGRCRAAGRGSISRSRALATKAASPSAGATGVSTRPKSPTVRASTVECRATSSPATTPPPTSGRKPPTAARQRRRG